MKEDKENTRPREKKVEIKCEDGEKSERPNKEKKEAMTKIVIRRLPPSLTKEELEEQLQPLPEVDYLEFFSSDTSLYPHLFARAYLNFKNQEDIVLFRDRFDGYVFIDSRGQEYPAIVEFAPFQKVAKKRSKKKDAKTGTIEEDVDYKKFLEMYNGGDDEKLSSTPETLLEEIEAKTKELFAKKTTPLLDFLKNKQRLREEKKEERRRRELERKRLRDEERRKWREEEKRRRKEAEKLKKAEKLPEKDKDQSKEEQPKIKLLKKPERPENGDTEKPKDKPKKPDREKLKDDRPPGGADAKKRQNGEHREDKPRKLEEDGRKEHRDRDADRDRDRDRERERRQKEKERIRRQDEERRRRRERHDGENTYKKREEEGKKEKERVWEKRKNDNTGDSSGHNQPDKSERSSKDGKKEDHVKKDRLRNKDRPAIQLYQPGARSRNRTGTGDGQAGDKKTEREAKNTQKGEE